jgi:hypothetical protein
MDFSSFSLRKEGEAVKESVLDSAVSPQEEANSAPLTKESKNSSGWLRFGVIATASALAGGLATAWYYRRTLNQLRQAENGISHSEIRIFEHDPAEDD